MSTTMTKRRKVINYLAKGNGLTASEAKSRYGIGNLRATISNIKSQVEHYGNWEVVKEATATGKTRYFMDDTHPGHRHYGFDQFGNRYTL